MPKESQSSAGKALYNPNHRDYKPPYARPPSQQDPLDRISGPSPLERISTSKDSLDSISGGDPLDRISRRRRSR